MAPIPFIGRLHIHEYLALGASFVLLGFEVLARTITLLLPTPIIRFLYRLSRNAFNSLSSPYSRRARNKKKSVSSPIAQAHDFVEICELSGYYAEEHVVQTKDGYLLGIHRLAWRRGEEDKRVNSGPGSVQKKVVYLHHGLMMNSEVWVCITEKERCLAFQLVEQGYDVWLGNNRGNKYSKKSLHYGPTEVPFWNFSMDQFAFHDIPDSINYILDTTSQPSLSYIGFSQGTAQAFATLSINPTLNQKVDVFVALAPAMAPPGLASGIVSSLVKSNPEVLFLLFGRRAILGSTTMWQALLYPAIFQWVIDKSLKFLFGWKALNIAPHQKLAAYPHLFSFTSTKSVVHWFQIIRNGNFQMFDDEVTSPTSFSTGSKYYKVAKFPTRNIKTPIVLVYGGSDSLVDINIMLKELPKHTIAKCVPKYEHLDLLWASDVDKLVFPHVLQALNDFAQGDNKGESLEWRKDMRLPRPSIFDTTNMGTPNGSQPPGYSEDERARAVFSPSGMPQTPAFEYQRRTITEEQMDESDEDDYADDTPPQTSESVAFIPSSFAHTSAAGATLPDSTSVRPSSSSTNATFTSHQRRPQSQPPISSKSPPRPTQNMERLETDHIDRLGHINSIQAQRLLHEIRAEEVVNRYRQNGNGDGNSGGPTTPVKSSIDVEPSSESGAAATSIDTDKTMVPRSRPEGWWSSTSSSSDNLVDSSTPTRQR